MRRALACWIALVAFAPLEIARAQESETPAQTAEATPDAAPDPPERIEARQRYQQGVVFFRAERYHEAIEEFLTAYAAWSNPLILYSLGQSYERLLEVPRAIDAYTRFLASVPEDDARRTEVTAKIDTLRLLLATLRVESNVPAHVWVDGEELGMAPGDIPLAIGRWDVEIRAAGYVTHRETVSLAARATETMHVVLEEVVETRVIERGGDVPLPVFVTFTAAALAAAGVAIGLGIHTLDLASTYDNDRMRTAADQAEGRTWSTATDVVGIGASVLAITAFVLAFLTDWDGDAPAPVSTSLIVTPNGAMMSLGAAF
jgi:tetratricopeptide (TPR) repeat protein